MSLALSLPDGQKHWRPNSRIYLNDVDTRGRSVDPRFIEAGYRKEHAFFRYRRDKLNDDAVVANLIEEAVYRASRARKTEPLDDVDSYLFAVFSNLADREISRAPRVLSFEPQSLEYLSKNRSETAKQILDRIQIREILHRMPPDVRWAYLRRSFGFEVQEIAREMHISADCLSTRMRRALRQTLQHLLGDDIS